MSRPTGVPLPAELLHARPNLADLPSPGIVIALGAVASA